MAKQMKESLQSSKPPASLIRRIARALLAVPAALWIFVEEWLWNRMLALTGALAKLPPIHWVEMQITRLPAYLALIAFLIPVAVLLPFKLAAFWLIAHGKGVLGMVVFIVAKIIGTAFLARIFTLTKPALMTIAWFARLYTAITSWKLRLYDYVRTLPIYRAIRHRATTLRRQAKSWWLRFKGA
jgi:hypothetical protein